MKFRTYCLACRKHTNNIGSKNSNYDKQSNQRQIKMC